MAHAMIWLRDHTRMRKPCIYANIMADCNGVSLPASLALQVLDVMEKYVHGRTMSTSIA